MILLIGKKNCGRCEMVKGILKNKNIPFDYVLLENLTEEEQSKYIDMATQLNKLSMPLIIKDNKLIDLQEV